MANYIFPNLPSSLDTGDTIRFNYTGAVQEFDVGELGNIKIECYGAKGGDAHLSGGLGGYTYGTFDCQLHMSKLVNDKLYILVGGQGFEGKGGWNAYGPSNDNCGEWNGDGANGGGATDIRTIFNGKILEYKSLSSRLIVAGGGGGSDRGGSNRGSGGAGGGWTGGYGSRSKSWPGTQTGGAGFGYGSGKGGGGWYGGKHTDGGGGGSSYVSGNSNCPFQNPYDITLKESGTTAGVNKGDGYVIITILSPGYKLYKKCLKIKKKNGTIQKIPLYEKTEALKKPYLPIRDEINNKIVYARLGQKTDIKASSLLIRLKNKIYAVIL